MAELTNNRPLIFYDDACGLCDRWVVWIINHDKNGRFLFAALRSSYGKKAQRAADALNAQPADTIILSYGGKYLIKSDAVLQILELLGGNTLLRFSLRVVPRFLRDIGYDVIARNRHRWFSRKEKCIVPSKEQRERFLTD